MCTVGACGRPVAARVGVLSGILTELIYGPFTVMLTLIPFVMIRGAHLPTLVAGLAFIPLRVLITVVSPLAGMRCRRFAVFIIEPGPHVAFIPRDWPVRCP